MKIIKVKNCETCPFYGQCPAWRALTRKQRVSITLSTSAPKDFILAKCHLDDDKQEDEKNAL